MTHRAPAPSRLRNRLLLGLIIGLSLAGAAEAVPPVQICDSTGNTCITPSGGGMPSPVTTQVYSGQIALSATAAALSGGAWSPSAPTALQNGIVCKAPTTNTGTVYVGPSGVTSSNGYPLQPGEPISFGPISMANLYALDATTTDILVCTGS